eukprot:97641-Amphidinium_carterae.1
MGGLTSNPGYFCGEILNRTDQRNSGDPKQQGPPNWHRFAVTLELANWASTPPAKKPCACPAALVSTRSPHHPVWTRRPCFCRQMPNLHHPADQHPNQKPAKS